MDKSLKYKVIAVTIPPHQKKFLEETGFKPSKILQQAINSLMESTNNFDLKQLIQHKQNKINLLLETVNKQREFLEKQGLLEEFIK